MDRKELDSFIDAFTFLRGFDCLESIDCMFDKMLKEDWNKESIDVNKQLMVVFLRTNYPIRDNLRHYSDFLDKSRDYLNDKGIEPLMVLRGLL